MAAYTTIDDPEAHFQVVTYTGNGSANNAITLPGDTDMQPDLVWIKNRDQADSWQAFDSIRGVGKSIQLDVDEEGEVDDADTLDAFQSDGFRVDADVKVNTNTEDYVAYCWKAGTTSGIATDGSTTITPTAYTFNTTAGFSVVKYTGNYTAGAGVAHGLGANLDFAINKTYGGTYEARQSIVYHRSIGSEKPMDIKTPLAPQTTDGYFTTTEPTSVNIFLKTSNENNEDGGEEIFFWSWASIQGYSKVGGSYVGNGSADGPFVYLGFRPAFLMTKRTDSTNGWRIRDNKRDPINPAQTRLYADTADTEQANDNDIDWLANGFKLRETGAGENASGGEYIYMAFAEAPFVNSSGVPCNAR